jgi:hypothetical protein
MTPSTSQRIVFPASIVGAYGVDKRVGLRVSATRSVPDRDHRAGLTAGQTGSTSSATGATSNRSRPGPRRCPTNGGGRTTCETGAARPSARDVLPARRVRVDLRRRRARRRDGQIRAHTARNGANARGSRARRRRPLGSRRVRLSAGCSPP